jgi:hypothetical protein
MFTLRFGTARHLLTQAVVSNGTAYDMSSNILRRILTNARGFSTGPPPAARSPYRHLRTLALGGSVIVTSYALGAVYPHPYITFISPRPAPAPPDPDSPQSIIYTATLEQTLQTLPLLTSHRAQPDAHEWYETRPYVNYPEQLRVNSLTAGALRGPGKLALPPLVRARKDESEAIVIVHVGRGVCGHDGIIHGGLLATILDESLARTVSFLCRALSVSSCVVKGDYQFTRKNWRHC